MCSPRRFASRMCLNSAVVFPIDPRVCFFALNVSLMLAWPASPCARPLLPAAIYMWLHLPLCGMPWRGALRNGSQLRLVSFHFLYALFLLPSIPFFRLTNRQPWNRVRPNGKETKEFNTKRNRPRGGGVDTADCGCPIRCVNENGRCHDELSSLQQDSWSW